MNAADRQPPRGAAARRLVACAFASALVLGAPPARADGQVWTGLESRVRASDQRGLVPSYVRWVNESRFGGRKDGLSFLLLRLGPMWELHRNVLFNLNGVQLIEADRAGVLRPESRIEVEPNLRGRLGPFTSNVRQRMEVRWQRAEATYRYRLQVRLNYQPDGTRIVPYVSSEIFFLTRARVGEVRSAVGLSFIASEHLRLDFAYVIRPRQFAGEWSVGHIGLFTVTFTPKVALIVESGGG